MSNSTHACKHVAINGLRACHWPFSTLDIHLTAAEAKKKNQCTGCLIVGFVSTLVTARIWRTTAHDRLASVMINVFSCYKCIVHCTHLTARDDSRQIPRDGTSHYDSHTLVSTLTQILYLTCSTISHSDSLHGAANSPASSASRTRFPPQSSLSR